MPLSRWKFLPAVLLVTANFIVGCGGGGGGGTTMPATPTFTSTPVMGAEEGVLYSYQVMATSSDKSAITYELSSGPTGATLSGNTVTWTPTHQESRVGNAFTVKATTAGGSATQTWNVTPNGTVNISAVTTYWGPNGSTGVAPQWLADLPYPAALVPQSDGSLQRLQGAANADGTFGIPNVPAGHYWLQINPNANYWTSASDFDDGFDVIGQQGSRTTQNTTTFDYMIGESAPVSGNSLVTARTNIDNLDLLNFAGVGTPTQVDFQNSVTSPNDWSKITTIYVSDYEAASSGSFSGFSLYSEQTLSNVTIVDGGTNSITATLTPSPTTSIPLSIQGTAWSSAAQGVGPGAPSVALSDYAVYAQPYLTDGIARGHNISFIGPDLPLLRPSAPSNPNPSPVFPGPFNCVSTTGPTLFPPGFSALPPITTDIDYGMVPYGDPYPVAWPRLFQYCEISTVSLPRPNSTAVDLFQAVNKQTTALPTGAVAPVLSTVQSPMISGSSLFSGTTLNTTSVTVSWNAPSVGQPFGYYVSVYELTNSNVSSTVIYAPAGRYGTTQTSVDVPFLSAGTYVFTITAVMDGGADMEKSPLRSKLPSAETGVVSAPIVIATGATATVKR